jgi:hypothetical protein
MCTIRDVVLSNALSSCVFNCNYYYRTCLRIRLYTVRKGNSSSTAQQHANETPAADSIHVHTMMPKSDILGTL